MNSRERTHSRRLERCALLAIVAAAVLVGCGVAALVVVLLLAAVTL